MIEIVESLNDVPLRFIPMKNSKLAVGDIVELAEDEGNTCVKLSDGTKPFGIVIEIDGPFGMVSVLYETMVLRTRNFDMSCPYRSGNCLYVNKVGKLTTVSPHEDAYTMGYVISPPGAIQAYLEMNWI